MPRAQRSNPLALAVLVCLLEAPMHPYQIAHTLRSRAKEDSVRLNYGSLYGVVESLERKGMIRARETIREGRRPERTVYEITETGAEEATDWLTEILAVPAKEFPQLMAGLSFIPALAPEEALIALRYRSEALDLRLVKLRAIDRAASEAGLPRLFSIESDYERSLLEAEIAFVGRLIGEIEVGSLDGLALWRSFHTDANARVPPPTLDGGIPLAEEAPPDSS